MTSISPPISDFAVALSSWLGLFQTDNQVTEAALGEVINVVKEEKIRLRIYLITLDRWQKPQSAADFHQLIEQIRAERKAGIKCLILWEDFWIARQEIVKSRIAYMLGMSQKIPGRLTTAERIDKQSAAGFLEQNHLNGSAESKYRFGLFLPTRYYRILAPDFAFDRSEERMLVAVATFSAPRIFIKKENPHRSFELIRFASVLNTNVIGGLDKLLRAFTSDRKPDDIMTYADIEWSDGDGYSSIGFERISEIPPVGFLLDPAGLKRFSGKKIEVAGNQTDYIPVCNAGSIKFVRTLSNH